jgi:hypothetical protein
MTDEPQPAGFCDYVLDRPGRSRWVLPAGVDAVYPVAEDSPVLEFTYRTVGANAPAEGEPGWYVPPGALRCPRCGDQNWETPSRRCITCTDGDDGYADGVFADGWSVEAAERARQLFGPAPGK